ncbi:MAG TPA: ABC transporter ATP-binding protein [Candidatus Sulfopaludibacter sp.]|jgi:lipopolysaccharide transport system ATP-binding protein|nr:ABC transporter ATP-binding protein [Candidatus Sulfopaludibacter sp.]
MALAVSVYDLCKRFRRYHADQPQTLHEALFRGFSKLAPAEYFWGLKDVEFEIATGRTLGVIGRNGAGKSTLLRLIGGVGRPDRGKITVNGNVNGLLRLGTGFHAELTGRENVMVSGVVGGLTRRGVREKFDAIVAFAELEDYIDNPLRVYSSGMQLRLAFSIAIHSSPDILLIDEVLSVGDLAFQRKCLDRLAQIKATGCTIIVVTHDVTGAKKFCDQFLWLRAGKMAAFGPVDTVATKYLSDADSETWAPMNGGVIVAR